jgi:hypothetical protein
MKFKIRDIIKLNIDPQFFCLDVITNIDNNGIIFTDSYQRNGDELYINNNERMKVDGEFMDYTLNHKDKNFDFEKCYVNKITLATKEEKEQMIKNVFILLLS